MEWKILFCTFCAFIVFRDRCDLTDSRLHVCPGCWIPRFFVTVAIAASLALD